MSERYAYPVTVAEDETGAVTITFPDVPEAITGAASRAKAMVLASDALDGELEVYIARGHPLPSPSPSRGRPVVAASLVLVAKAALHDAVQEKGLGVRGLARRLGIAETEARRLLDPKHATKIGRLQKALAAFGRQLVGEIRSAA
jgi:antitoxin HicB